MDVRVTTLGKLAIHCDGEPIASLPAQPVRCALLVILALERTITRESLLALLWPERDSERGRHALSQALYELRRLLGDAWVDAQRDSLSATARLHSDAHEVERAVQRGDHASVIELYGGDFLSGIRLVETRTFEEWVDRKEARLRQLHRESCRAEIDRRTRADELGHALETARHWVRLDPLEDEARHKLIDLLARTGRQVEALRQYETYARLLREELDVEPLEETRAIVERIREGDTGPLRATLPETERPPDRPARTPTAPSAGPADGARRRWRGSGYVAALAILALLALAVVRVGDPARRAAGERVPVAVPSFTAAQSGVDRAELDALARRFTNLMEMVGGVRAIAPDGVVDEGRDWRSVPLETLLARAQATGAGYLAAGSVVGATDSAEIALDLYDLRSGEHTRWSGGRRTGEPLESVLDRLAFQVVRHIAGATDIDLGPEARFGFGTSSPVAFSHIREGRLRLARGDVEGAIAGFRRAVRADPGYGLAYYRWSVAETFAPRWNYEAGLAAVRKGLEHDSLLAPRWRLLLEAQRHYVLRQADSAIAGFQRIVPDNGPMVDAWIGLAESLYHLGFATGHRLEDARPALRRAAELDSSFNPIYQHLITVAFDRRDIDEVRALLPHVPADNPRRPAWEAAIRLESDGPELRRETLEALRTAERPTISYLVEQYARGGRDLGRVDTLATFLTRPDRTPGDRLRGARYRLVALAGLGRWPDAVRSWREIAIEDAFDPWVLEAHFAGYPAAALAEPMLDDARARLEAGRTPDFGQTPWHESRHAFRALVYDATIRGDSGTVRTLLDVLRRAAPTARASDPLPGSLRASLESRLALLAADTARAIRHLDRAVGRPAEPYLTFFPLTSLAPQRLLLAELRFLQGESTPAMLQLRSFESSPAIADALYRDRVARISAVYDR